MIEEVLAYLDPRVGAYIVNAYSMENSTGLWRRTVLSSKGALLSMNFLNQIRSLKNKIA